MIKRILFILCIVFLCVVPVTLANDGGAFPDYNEYVTYTVETDCKEVAIGGEIEFSMTLKNHTKATFEPIFMQSVFNHTYLNADDEMNFWDYFEPLEPYSTQKIVFSYTVPENVKWYKKGEEFFVDLRPDITYSFDINSEENSDDYGLPHFIFTNMIGVKPIPIKLTNVYDGSVLIDFEIVDNNKLFIYSDRYDRYESESYIYAGEYEGEIKNYLSIKNISDNPIDIINIDGYNHNSDQLFINSLDEIIVPVTNGIWTMKDEIEDLMTVDISVRFKDKYGKYYGVTTGGEYKTKVYEIPNVDITAIKVGETVEGNQLIEISLTNTSNEDIEEFFIYYEEEFPETKEQLYDNVIRECFKAGNTLEMPEQIEVPVKRVNTKHGSYLDGSHTLRLGYWVDNSLCYWKVFIEAIEDEASTLYTNDDYAYGWYEDIYDLTHDIEVFDIESALKATPMPETTSTPKPEITTEVKQTITPTSTPQATNVVVKEVVSYVIPPWVYVVLGIAFVAVVGLVVWKRNR